MGSWARAWERIRFNIHFLWQSNCWVSTGLHCLAVPDCTYWRKAKHGFHEGFWIATVQRLSGIAVFPELCPSQFASQQNSGQPLFYMWSVLHACDLVSWLKLHILRYTTCRLSMRDTTQEELLFRGCARPQESAYVNPGLTTEASPSCNTPP